MTNSTFQGSLLTLRKAMRETQQMPNLSVLQHGIQVARYFDDLHQHIEHDTPLKYEWKLPEWVYNKTLWSQIMSLKTVRTYQIYHDCGKPFCRTVDDAGKQHFPDHATTSADIWMSLTGEKEVSYLMAHDMDIHLLKGNQVQDFAQQPQAATLLLTGLSELHANASMFGGIESTSFKIKFKQINRRGKAIVALLNDKSSSNP
jgi:hypothetical protein